MDKKIDEAILVLTNKITPAIREDQALKFTQAALNLAHVKSIYEATSKTRTKGAGS
jgi:hypothetical protein